MDRNYVSTLYRPDSFAILEDAPDRIKPFLAIILIMWT